MATPRKIKLRAATNMVRAVSWACVVFSARPRLALARADRSGAGTQGQQALTTAVSLSSRGGEDPDLDAKEEVERTRRSEEDSDSSEAFSPGADTTDVPVDDVEHLFQHQLNGNQGQSYTQRDGCAAVRREQEKCGEGCLGDEVIYNTTSVEQERDGKERENDPDGGGAQDEDGDADDRLRKGGTSEHERSAPEGQGRDGRSKKKQERDQRGRRLSRAELAAATNDIQSRLEKYLQERSATDDATLASVRKLSDDEVDAVIKQRYNLTGRAAFAPVPLTCKGKDCLFPGMTGHDNGQGLTLNQKETITGPAAAHVSMSWDPELIFFHAHMMGKVFRGTNANAVLGPGAQVWRNPRCGRLWEYLPGEDPILGVLLVEALTLGYNKQKVGPILKHYINNDKELGRTLRKGKLTVPWEAQTDIYLKPFVAGSNVGAAAAMCGYNWLVDPEGGEPVSMCFNKRLKWLTEQSKRTWVLTDYPAAEQVGYPTKYLSADPPYNVTPDNTSMATDGHSWVSWGNKWADWHMPLEYEKRNAVTQLKESVGIAEEDGGHQVMANQIDKADRELKNAYVAGFVGWGKSLGIQGTDDHYTDVEHKTWYSELDEANKQKFYRWTSRTIAESFVLLKNEGNLLPLNEKETVFIDSSCKNHAEVNLTAQGSGEASVHLRQTTAATAFSKKIGNKEKAKVHLSCSFGLAGEGNDRGSISLPKPTMGDKAKTCVFVSTPGSIELSWAHEAPCIVLGIAPSVFGFNGLSYLFYGKVNPGGHTIMSVVTNAADLEFGDGDSKRETGYMMLQVRGKTPAFEFGWGLPFGATSWDEVAEIVPKQHDRTIRRIAFCFKGKLAPHPGVPPPNPTAQLWHQVEGRKWRQLLTFVKHRGLAKGAEECYASYYDPVTEWDDGENGKYVPKPFKLFYGLNGYRNAREWPTELESGRDEVKPFQRAKYPEHVWARHLSNQRETGNSENVGRVFTGKGRTGDAVVRFWEGQENPEAAYEDKLCRNLYTNPVKDIAKCADPPK